ncbi:MAG: S46 family peptidase, partial [Pyrinomonadaceae bacterium]
MKRFLVIFLHFSLLTTTTSVLADDGMWTFDNPPLQQWKKKYNFEPSKEWLEKVRLASVKFPGASGAFVSPNGLIATNNHVASGIIAKLSTKDRDLQKTGFYAKTQADELKAQDTEITVLQ